MDWHVEVVQLRLATSISLGIAIPPDLIGMLIQEREVGVNSLQKIELSRVVMWCSILSNLLLTLESTRCKKSYLC